MLAKLVICDLTKFTEFVYWPMRDGLDDTMEKVMDSGDVKDVKSYAVFGKYYIPRIGEAEDLVAEFSTLIEAASYCVLLNQAVEGRATNLEQYKQ